MNIPYSKKELYKDNLAMRKEIANLISVNSELVILNEQMQEKIDSVNEKIKLFNRKLNDAMDRH